MVGLYKWLKRFDNAGLEGLKNKHNRSGRPPEEVSEETSIRIRGELSENQSGWMDG
jgi:transposase